MQNKPNFHKHQNRHNISYRKHLREFPAVRTGPKQTQSNPISNLLFAPLPSWREKIRLEAFGQCKDIFLYLVADLSKDAHYLLIGAGGEVWIFERMVDHFGIAWENGTILPGVVAKCDDVIEIDTVKIVDVIRDVFGDIDADLSHYPDRPFADTYRFYSSRKCFDGVTFEMPCPGFSDLASTGIAGAEEHDVQLWFICIL
jgi:hypothetical protein